MANRYIYILTTAVMLVTLNVVTAIHAANISNSSTAKNTISDSAITAAIKSKYLADSRIKALNIHVETTDGKVTLTGTVPNYDIKEIAESVAKNTNGVKDVISKLETTDASKDVKTAVSDTAITAAIKSKYLADSRIKALNVHVETTNGKVTLTGTVPNYDIKEIAESVARNTNGVKDVISKLEITDTSKDAKIAVSDTTITAAIKSKYLADDNIKSLIIYVETTNGIVTLTGDVPNEEIKRNIESIAKNTDGVKDVINKTRMP